MRRIFAAALMAAALLTQRADAQTEVRTGAGDRQTWCEILCRIGGPVLDAMSEGRLHEKMKIEVSPTWDGRTEEVAYMECFGRLMAGMAPWLALPDDDTPEGVVRKRLREKALKCYAAAVDPDNSDYLFWREEPQPLVDAAYIAESFMRAYDALWMPLDETTKQRYIAEFTQLRRVNPAYSNWLLFSSTVECFLRKAGAPHDAYRISSALRKIEEWYVGDGWYSDGPHFALDYYNSYVIHPMYVECLEIMTDGGRRSATGAPKESYAKAIRRMQRFGITLERLISPEGAFPPIGRSITYRTGVLQPLGMMALCGTLPGELPEGQVRAAMTAVIRRMFDNNQNFNADGFLTLGFNGSQPGISDWYTNNGSLYIAAAAFLPLGLPADHTFWTSEPQPWTARRAWDGMDFPKDGAYKE